MAQEALKHAPYVIRREGHVGSSSCSTGSRAAARDELHAVSGLSWIGSDGQQINNPEAAPASSEDLDAFPSPRSTCWTSARRW